VLEILLTNNVPLYPWKTYSSCYQIGPSGQSVGVTWYNQNLASEATTNVVRQLQIGH